MPHSRFMCHLLLVLSRVELADLEVHVSPRVRSSKSSDPCTRKPVLSSKLSVTTYWQEISLMFLSVIELAVLEVHVSLFMLTGEPPEVARILEPRSLLQDLDVG